MKKTYASVLIATFVLAFHVTSRATIIYVRAAATGANNGANWTDAFTDLQAGFGATLPGDTIWVAAGVYKPTTTTTRTISFALPDGVKIFGGFNGTETLLAQRNFTTNVTNLSGDIGVTGNSSDNSYHVVTTAGVSNSTVLDGFRILSGNANSSSSPDERGGAILNSTGSPVIRNCTMQNNTGTNAGAVYQQTGGTLSLINCTIINNTSTAFYTGATGGVSISNGTIFMEGCSITQNSGYNGGAINMLGGSMTVNRCILSGNSANNNGGAVYAYGSVQFTMTNSLVVGNLASNGGVSAIYCVAVPVYNHRIINCTIADNRASASSSAANIFSNFSEIDNTLFSGNSETTELSGTALTTNNNMIVGVNLSDAHFISPGDNSFAPFSASSYNYHVAAFSDCVDYGNAAYVIPAYNTDLDNTARVQGPAPDCGCYETSGCTFNLLITSPDSSAICSGSSTTLTASGGTVFLWQDNSTNSSFTTSAAGTYSVEADSAGCYGTATYQVTLINPNLSITGPSGFCPGDSILLTANGNNISNYSWSTSDTTNSIVVSAAGTYSVSITTAEGCTASSSTTITAYALPNPVLTFNNPVISTTTTFTTYQWLFNGVPINGANAQQYTITQNGDYSVIVTNATGCEDTSSVFTILNVAVPEISSETFGLYPNPCADQVTLTSKDANLQNRDIRVTDSQGRVVDISVGHQDTNRCVLNLASLQPGVYIIVITDEAGTTRIPVVKQ